VVIIFPTLPVRGIEHVMYVAYPYEFYDLRPHGKICTGFWTPWILFQSFVFYFLPGLVLGLTCPPLKFLFAFFFSGTWNFVLVILFCPVAHQPLVDQGLHIIEASRSHSDTPHAVGLLWTIDRPDAKTSTWYNTTFIINIYVPGGIRTHNPNQQAAADPRLRSRGQSTIYT